MATAGEERGNAAQVGEGDSEEKSGATAGRDLGAETSGSVIAEGGEDVSDLLDA